MSILLIPGAVQQAGGGQNYIYSGKLTVGSASFLRGYFKGQFGTLTPTDADVDKIYWSSFNKAFTFSYIDRPELTSIFINNQEYVNGLQYQTDPFPANGEDCSIKIQEPPPPPPK